jgi:hypothetical protein
MSAQKPVTPDVDHLSALFDALGNWARTEGQVWMHVCKTVAAALLAMGIAMRLDLASPRTAMVTVFILMQPQTGMVLAKSLARRRRASGEAGENSGAAFAAGKL